MIRRFRVLLPPAWALLLFVVFYVLVSLPAILWSRPFGGQPPAEFYRPQQVFHAFAAIAYGLYRVLAFHPLYRSGYRTWLLTTPWAWPRPLPAGPVQLVWEDAVIVTAAGLPIWAEGTFHPLGTASLVMGAYLVALAQTFWTTGARAFGYAVFFGVGLSLRLWRAEPTTFAGVMAATYLVGMLGLRRSLRRWPSWGELPSAMTPQFQSGEPAAIARRLGWPFDRLGPKFTHGTEGVRTLDGLLGGLLGGWWLFAGESLIVDPTVRLMIVRMGLIQATLIGASFRLSGYVTGYAPPISLGGRFRTLRPIIPSYDQVIAAPFVALIAGCAGPVGLGVLGLSPDVAMPISLTLTLWALLVGGPERRRWWLTGRHRIVAGAKAIGFFVQTG